MNIQIDSAVPRLEFRADAAKFFQSVLRKLIVPERKVSKYGSKRVGNPRVHSRGQRGLQIPLEREKVFRSATKYSLPEIKFHYVVGPGYTNRMIPGLTHFEILFLKTFINESGPNAPGRFCNPRLVRK